MTAISNESQNGSRPKGITDERIDQAEIDELLDDERTDRSDLSTNETFEILKNRRRRAVLKYLDDVGGHATLDTIAEHVAAEENGIDTNQLSSQQRKRVYIGLYQVHLPKMDDLGIIEYDQDRGTVELEDISELRPYLYDEKSGVESRLRSLTATVVGGIVMLGTLGTAPAAIDPTVLLALLGSVTLLAIGLYPTITGSRDG